MDEHTIHPTGNKVLVRLARVPSRSPSGLLYIPETSRDPLHEGVIVSMGPEVKSLSLGKYIWWDIGKGWRIDEDLLLIEEDHVQCFLEKEPT